MIKKLIVAGAVAGAIMATALPAFAKVEREEGWILNPDSPIVFTCGGSEYPHTLDTVSQDGGDDFSGTGTYDNGAHTWNIDGNISGDDLSFTIVYTTVNAGYTLNNLDGVIAPNGSITGSVDNNCESYVMPAGSASKFEGNHGQYVRMSENKKEAAHSRLGMPSQSKGHTK